MAIRKSTSKYYFSVEGETEQWYLKWLQDVINNTEESAYKVSFDCPVQKIHTNVQKLSLLLKPKRKKFIFIIFLTMKVMTQFMYSNLPKHWII